MNTPNKKTPREGGTTNCVKCGVVIPQGALCSECWSRAVPKPSPVSSQDSEGTGAKNKQLYQRVAEIKAGLHEQIQHDLGKPSRFKPETSDDAPNQPAQEAAERAAIEIHPSEGHEDGQRRLRLEADRKDTAAIILRYFPSLPAPSQAAVGEVREAAVSPGSREALREALAQVTAQRDDLLAHLKEGLITIDALGGKAEKSDWFKRTTAKIRSSIYNNSSPIT